MSFAGVEKGENSIKTDMNNNHYSRGRNFGAPFVPPSSYFQGHNNKFNAGMYGFPFGPGMHHMQGPYPNSNKTFCTTAANMNANPHPPVNGYHRNGQQQQKFNFQNCYPPQPQPQYQYQTGNAGIPSNNNGFLNGLKNIVNHLISPKCDFYSDHSRRYNPKHRNNYKYDPQQQIPVQTTYPDEVFGSVVFNIGAYCQPTMQGAKVHVAPHPQFNQNPTPTPTPSTASQPKSPPTQQSKPTPTPSKQNCIKVTYKPASPEIIAIFTSEDFPELPKPKKPTFCATFPKPKCPAEKGGKSPSPCPNPQNGKKPPVASGKPPVTKSPKQPPKVRQISECSSEDSFIVFANESPVCSVKNQTPSTPPTLKFHSGLLPFRQRQRQISECSDDSFVICFQDESGNSNPEIIDFSDFSDESDSEDEDEDEVDGGVCGKHIDDDNDDADDDDDVRDRKAGNRLCNYGTAYRETSQPDSGFDEKKEKKVRFNLKPDVHVMHSWDFAYRAARKGPWEEIARDRCRFKQRIEKLGEIIGPILSDNHRMKIFNARFCDNVTNECNNSLDQVCKSNKDVS